MLSTIYRILVSFCLFVAVVMNVAAETIDDSPEVVSLYARGKRLMREGDWYGAATLFQDLEGQYSNSPNIDLFIFNKAKSKYYLGDYSGASATFSYFLARFPGSTLRPYGHFFLGNVQYLSGDVNRAVRSYLKAYQFAETSRLRDLVLSSMVEAFGNAASIGLTEADFEQLSQAKKCALIKPLAEILISRGEFNQADNLLSICGEKYNPATRPDVAARLAQKQLEIALVLPLSGELSSFGQEIVNGATVAADMYRQETGKSIKLSSYDSKGDPVEAARIIGELSRLSVADAVIGPLTSDEAAVASAALSCSSLPLITPAATQAGLTRLSSTSFQLAPNVDLEGVTLAEYAFRRLGADSVAIISSTSTDHLRMTRAFAEHFERLGGKIVATQYYRSRDNDFGIYIRDIKNILVGQPPDSTFYVNEDGDTLDLDVIPAYVDCIFLPGDPKQLRQLLPQINFYNLNGQYLGSDGWGDEVVYRLGDNITKGAVFSSPFLEGKQSAEYVKLASAYDARYGTQPQRLSALGYDAVRLITRAVLRDQISRDAIAGRLREVTDYAGASGKISFGEHRENIEMPLYRIESERASLLSQQNTPAGTTTEVGP